MKKYILTALMITSPFAYADKVIFEVEVGVGSDVLGISLDNIFNVQEKLIARCANMGGKTDAFECKTSTTKLLDYDPTDNRKAIASACTTVCKGAK